MSLRNFQSMMQIMMQMHRISQATSQAATLLIENISHAMEEKMSALCVFLDLSKAIDTIEHSTLLSKIYHYGIGGVAHNWFTSYLENRSQYVLCSNILSSYAMRVSHGVPQGSNLDPLLFLIHVNDFKNCLNIAKAIMFADDTTIISTKKNLPELFISINEELMNIDAWLIANKLSVNIKKTNYILFQTIGSHCPENLTVRLRNVPIQKVSSIKFLGLHLQENLSWKLQMEHVLTKVRCGLSIARKAKPYLNQESLLILYHTMIMSHILYCITVWCHDNKTIVQKLQRSVYNFIRIIFDLNPRDSAVGPMKSHKFLTINHLMIKETSKFMFHFNNNRLPPVFKNFFLTKKTENLPVQTRSGSTLIPSFGRLSTTQQS